MERCVEGRMRSTWENMHVMRGRKKLPVVQIGCALSLVSDEIMGDRLLIKAGLNIKGCC